MVTIAVNLSGPRRVFLFERASLSRKPGGQNPRRPAMSQRQPQIAPRKSPRPQVGFEVREIMSLLTALEARGTAEDRSHVH
ncbi:MAG TPA: hypothetical protein VGD07_00205 [Methylomirabilota bacterium]